MKISEIRQLSIDYATFLEDDKVKRNKLVKYLKETATPYQCMGFLLDSKLYKLNENSESEVKYRFIREQSDPHALKTSGREERKRASSIIGVVSNPVGYLGYRSVKAIFSKCARKCGSFRINSPERVRCLAACKQQAKQR